jgi:hypothetical protein
MKIVDNTSQLDPVLRYSPVFSVKVLQTDLQASGRKG